MKRRDFIKYSLAATGALGIKFYSIPAFAAEQRKEKIVYIFLRGGADFLSLFPPRLDSLNLTGEAAKDYRNHPLYAYRGLTAKMCDSFLFGSVRYPFGDYEAGSANAPLEIPGYPVLFHPGFSPLRSVLGTNDLAVLLHTGSVNGSRSHFDQQDMIESGSDLRKFSTGYLARAASLLNSGRNPLAIGEMVPRSLAGADVPLLLSAADVTGLTSVASGRVWAAQYAASGDVLTGMDLNRRLDFFRTADVNCESSTLCKTASDAKVMYAKLGEDLKDYSPETASDFKEACALAAKLTTASFNPAIMTIDFPGWDHHYGEHPKVENSALYAKVTDLASGLNTLYQGMSADTVVVVMSEFGRTVVGNVSLGTDHGRGGAMMLMGKKIARSSITNIPTAWNLSANSFDGSGSSRALKVNIDYREIVAELLHKHLQVPWTAETPLQEANIKTIFDGLARYTGRGLV